LCTLWSSKILWILQSLEGDWILTDPPTLRESTSFLFSSKKFQVFWSQTPEIHPCVINTYIC
jgi:hypothetical protein